jgi:hypothetical protein
MRIIMMKFNPRHGFTKAMDILLNIHFVFYFGYEKIMENEGREGS